MDEEWNEVLEPDYYPLFHCKCGQCRASCCGGWGISISMEEYFRLLGMDCPPPLRRRLDDALHLLADSTPERYAQLTPDWRGRCPLQREDGFCGLQCECGEQALPQICRQYPRGLRHAFEAQRACSNSCEATLELLFSREEPIRLQRGKGPVPPREGNLTPGQARQQREIRDGCITTLQQRQYPLPVRLVRLGAGLCAADARDGQGVQVQCQAAWRAVDQVDAGTMPPPDLQRAFAMQLRLVQALAMDQPGVCAEAEAACALFGQDGQAPGRYASAAAAFARHYPKWEIWFEQMLVNQVIFEGFPYSERGQSPMGEYAGLCAAYGLLRFLAVGCTVQRHDVAQLVDVCAAAFRLIAHTAFCWNAPIVLGPDAQLPGLAVLVQN